MSAERFLPVLLWPISCFDRRRKNPLPVYNRFFWLDWSTLTPQQIAEILAIIEAQKERHIHSPSGLEESVITMSIGAETTDTRMLNYRHLFTEVPENNIEAFWNAREGRNCGFQFVRISREYFEDETGTPISNYEMIQHVSGQEFPIIVGNAESVLRLGAIDPVNVDDWSVERANTIAQFLDVVQRIHRSAWYRSPSVITSLSHKSGDGRLLEADFPDDEKTMSILAYFRQLHAGDRLVVNACDAYVHHAGDAHKQWWISERKQTFESLVDSPPMPFNTDGKSRREIVRMFMYGAGLLHSCSNHGDDVALDDFIAKHGKHKMIMIFNSCLMDLYRIAASIFPVIRQDYQHWLNNAGFAPPSRVSISDLFAGFSTPTKST